MYISFCTSLVIFPAKNFVQYLVIEVSQPSFALEFHFSENPYFSNTVLRKAYILEENGVKINYDHIEP